MFNSTGTESPGTTTTTTTTTGDMSPPANTTLTGLLHQLLTKSAQVIEKVVPMTTDTVTEVITGGGGGVVESTTVTSVTHPTTMTSSTAGPTLPDTINTSTLWNSVTTVAGNVTLGLLDEMTGNTSDVYNYDYDDEEDYVVVPVHHTPHRHYNKTLWRGEVDHHMVNMDYDDSPPEHFNDVIYVIVVVIFYGAVLVLAFVIQMRRRNHYNDIDSEHFNEYLHMKWDVLEKKRLLGKERVGKMRCLVDAPNVAFIPEQSV